MRKASLLPLAGFLVASTFASISLGDVASPCRCQAPGVSPQGSAAAVTLLGGLSIALLSRKRARKP
ncbi:hypothetical protein [Polyangium sp. 6x1]|uniref:hypothetical protein n=1 Tax=Polyangium sp. 6x1 TaxID=3042689 RepID=UPI002482D60A|nr:hypothetical protein [Polyangium sp. 6x1]MDI1447914.1 hypothetical protein [Polyangium sp. 6x1]